jgi:hypothetical protein
METENKLPFEFHGRKFVWRPNFSIFGAGAITVSEWYGVGNTYGFGDILFNTNLTDPEHIKEAIKAYALGCAAGNSLGRKQLQNEMKKLLDV